MSSSTFGLACALFGSSTPNAEASSSLYLLLSEPSILAKRINIVFFDLNITLPPVLFTQPASAVLFLVFFLLKTLL